ncbi:3'(2'),5'-bisphosphate nucleotidase CysQ [mine drainage metagenome]|uniref:3'(2'),5'-bisphosphate nucleotidase CysQ n=1 Tax=mine drainage metagenome TaxID=410659 RepID=A0A1J5PCR1_9ZZZZ
MTEADRQAELLILRRLAEAFPDVHVVSEEHASEYGAPEAVGDPFFLVDPIDGTKAFVRGDPNFTVNIGLISGKRPIAGAVMAPVTGETWFTRDGRTFKRIWGGPETEWKIQSEHPRRSRNRCQQAARVASSSPRQRLSAEIFRNLSRRARQSAASRRPQMPAPWNRLRQRPYWASRCRRA